MLYVFLGEDYITHKFFVFTAVCDPACSSDLSDACTGGVCKCGSGSACETAVATRCASSSCFCGTSSACTSTSTLSKCLWSDGSTPDLSVTSQKFFSACRVSYDINFMFHKRLIFYKLGFFTQRSFILICTIIVFGYNLHYWIRC